MNSKPNVQYHVQQGWIPQGGKYPTDEGKAEDNESHGTGMKNNIFFNFLMLSTDDVPQSLD